MKALKFLTTATLALLPLTASAAALIIPASGTGPGANGSHWATELTLHNASSQAINITIKFHDQSGNAGSTDLTVAGRTTSSIEDIVATKFARTQATGALEILVADADAPKLTVSSRTFNTSDGGEFGQDIPAVKDSDASTAGDLSVLIPPASATDYRFNFGLYALTDTNVQWQLIRADGTIAGTKLITYTAGTQTQYNNGINVVFNAQGQTNDVVQAGIVSGKAIFYGSAVNAVSGDPTYVPSARTREDVHIDFIGVDLDENGTADVTDANHDGVLDSAIDVFTSGFPNYFRVIVKGENGEVATYQVVEVSGGDLTLTDTNGTVEYAAPGDLRGKSGFVKLRATAGGSSAVLTIPVNFR